MAITRADYNNLQASVQRVLGIGDTVSPIDTTYGYGQSVTSSQIAAGSVITSAQWDNLRNDLVNCVLYQNGGGTSNINTILPPITQGNPISSAILTKFQAAATTITTNRNPAIVPSSPVNQGTRATLGTDSTYTGWSGTITESIILNFSSPTIHYGTAPDVVYTYSPDSISASKFFFNSGGLIEFSATLTGSSGTLKDNSWSTFFSSIGTVRFGLKGTTQTGASGGTTNIGFANLTTTDQVIFTTSTTGTYLNVYEIKAKQAGIGPGQITFTVKFNDSTGIISGVDSLVTGTTTSTCQALYPSGPYVVLYKPTIALRNSVVVNAPTYAITANAPGIVNQGSNQAFTVTTTNISNGTTLYWTTNLASTKGSTQGTTTINGNSGTITVATFLDYATTATSYTVSLRVGGYTDQVVTSATASIRAATPTYSVSANRSTMTENSDTVTFTFSTTAVPNGTSLFWKTNAVPGYNSIDAPDFVSIPSSYVTINNNTANFALTTVADLATEGTEAFTVSVHLTSASAALSTSAPVYISDTSTRSVSISPDKTLVNGNIYEYVTFNISSQGYSGLFYWAFGGTAPANRFVNGEVSGQVSTSSFYVRVAPGGGNNPAHTFYAQLYTDAARTQAAGSPSATVTIMANGNVTFLSTSQWTAPAGVNQIQVSVTGGIGGKGGTDVIAGTNGWNGSTVTGTVSVIPGTVYNMIVGAVGGNGANGTGSGGGGGGAGNPTGYSGGAGGNAGSYKKSNSGGGGGGGAPSGIVSTGGTIVVVAGGGGGGGGAGRDGGNRSQVSGAAPTTKGGGGASGAFDGGGGGGGGGGHPYGGAGGNINGQDLVGRSGANGQSTGGSVTAPGTSSTSNINIWWP